MDSGTANYGNSHHQNGGNDNFGNVDFLGGIQDYANTADQDEMQQFFHPDLFESQGQDFNAGMQQAVHQQPQQTRQPTYPSSAFAQNAQRTQSPPMQSYAQNQQFSQHSQYSQSLYNQRNLFQQPQYDPRLYQQHPSHSPAPNDQYPFAAQTYPTQNTQGQMIQPRATASPAPQYHTGQQPMYASFGSFDSRGPTLPQRQDADLIQFANFQNGSQQTAHSFVNPNMLNAEPDGLRGGFAQMPHRQMQQTYYASIPQGHNQQKQQQQQQQQQPMSQAMQPQQMQAQTPQYTQSTVAQVTMKQANDPNAPKRPRGRPRKDGTIPKTDGAGSTRSASSSDLEIEDELPVEATPTMITTSLPTDERVKYPYLAVKAVWSDRNRPAPLEKIKSGIVDFGENLRSLRDVWKAKNDKLKQAELETSANASEAPRLKMEVATYRQIAETLISKALLFGHPSILKSLGENLYTLSAMYSFMADRFTASDYESALLVGMLKFGESFATLDDEKLESGKWNKLLQRLTKKASGEAKTLAQKILDNAKAVTANNKKDKANGDVAAGVKRAREGDITGPATKRVVKTSSKPLALQALERKRAQEAADAAKKGKTAPSSGTLITPAAAKPKVPLSAPKTTSFASLMSASKKPGTTNAERAAAVKKDGTPVVQQVKKEPLKRDSPPASVGSTVGSGPSFLSSLLNQEKKEASPKREEDVPTETPEQKAKRMRKESRRKLRVSWKNDSELVETRLFTHDPDEEINRGDSAMKDAGDTGKEGEMLKRAMPLEDLDDDDDDGDFDPDSYEEPSAIDFSELLAEDATLEENGVKHGGKMKAESKSAETQDKLEDISVMAIYATVSDRPDTPKEAPEEGDDDFNPSDDFGSPDAKVRDREKEIYSRRRSQGFGHDGQNDFASNLQAMNTVPLQPYAAPATQNSGGDLLSQLTAMGLIQNQAAQQPQVSAPAPAFDLASLVANFSGQNAAAQQYQQSQPSIAPAQNESLQAIMARLQQGQNNASYNQANDYGGKKPKKTKKAVPKDEQGRPLNYKTKMCEFWEQGTCLYGDNCNYRHSK